MDRIALTGLVISVVAVALGNSMEGGSAAALLDAPAFIIVIGGTIGATVLQTPWDRLRRSVALLRWIVTPPTNDTHAEISRVKQWSVISRRDGMLGLENIADKASEPLRRKGLQMLVDGLPPELIHRVLINDIKARIEFDSGAAMVFRAMGGYAPTIGILGAVIGLIQVLGNLANPDELGQGIATAFVATIYGVGFANLLFLPIADRLRTLVLKQAQIDEVFTEGLIAIADGEHPKSIELRLQGCYSDAYAG